MMINMTGITHAQGVRNQPGILRFSIVRIVAAMLATILPVALTFIAVHQIPDKSLRIIWPQLLAAALAAAGYAAYVKRVERRRADELAGPRIAGELARGIALGGGLLLAVLAPLAAYGAYRIDGVGTWQVLAKPAAEMLVVALVEEIVFRGILFRMTEQARGTRFAFLVSSLLFALAHLPNESVTPLAIANTAVAGALLCAAYLWTRRLWFPIGLHFAWNFLSDAVFSLPTSGHPARGLLLGSLTGPEWLSGGAYGVEGSALTLAAMAVATGCLLWRRSGSVVRTA